MSSNKKSFLFKVIVIGAVLFVCIGLMRVLFSGRSKMPRTNKASILALKLKGVLLEKDKFLEHLRVYSKDDNIKGILIRLDSPGGSVALSQEIYLEFKNIREELKKPVVVSAGSIMASGALYAAAGASSIVVNSGTLVGSIGVIIPLVNLQGLYEWAKVERYSIKTGEFKDSTSSYRPMTANERVLFQELTNDLLNQFKRHIMEGRNISPEELEPFTDARIFTGETAVSAGFADSIGTYTDAISIVGELSGLGKDPHLFTPQPGYFELFSSRLSRSVNKGFSISQLFQLSPDWLAFLRAQPLYIFPPAIGM